MTKEWLLDYRARVLEARQIRGQLEQLAAELGSTKSPSLSGLPGGHEVGRPTEQAGLQLAALAAIYRDFLAQLAADTCRLENALQVAGLSPTERMVMRARYVAGLKWEQAAEQLAYSWQHLHRLHASAIAKLEGLTE